VAEVFGRDARAFTPGTTARVSLPDTGEKFTAKVSDVVPEVDPATRALRVRLIAENPRLALRPEMYVNVDMPVSMEPALTVPVDALLNSGLTSRVFVADRDGYFEPREVQTGWTSEDRVQILHGLHEGEMVAASGTFLIDSESRLQTPVAQLHRAALPHSAGDRNRAE
jgi:Cu(I)/Ag(I) efflux system membrane fusion protein